MQRRTVIIAAASVVPLVWGVSYIRPYLWGSGKSTAVPLEEVIDRFDEATTMPGTIPDTTPVTSPVNSAVTSAPTTEESAPEPVPDVMPRPGVYLYDTSGRDSVDALSGDSHTYPATTTISVFASGCGTLQRWDVLVQRWHEIYRCERDGGVGTDSIVNFDSFFERGQTDTYECRGDARPVDAAAGTTWSVVCSQGGRDDVHSGTVVGVEPKVVGGTAVDTLHVRVSISNGNPVDTQVTDSWYLLGTDLLVAEISANDTTNDSPIGDVHYTERYEITLRSLDPVN